MELTQRNITEVVRHYGFYKWRRIIITQSDTTTSGYYNFTTDEFSEWYAKVRDRHIPPLFPQPSFQEINIALKKHQQCQQVCSNHLQDGSWCWRLQPE
jgi:hypothetical protein